MSARAFIAGLMFAFSAGAGAQAIGEAVLPSVAGSDVVINPLTHRAFIADFSGGTVAVVEGKTRIANLSVGPQPNGLALSKALNRVYVSNRGGGIAVIDGNSLSVTTVAVTDPAAIVVNERTNRAYALKRATVGEIVVIEGAGNAARTMRFGTSLPYALALNAATNRLYVSYPATRELLVIDLATETASSIALGARPGLVAVDESANRIYVLTDDRQAPVTVIDGASNVTHNLAVANHDGSLGYSLALNPVTRRLYAGFSTQVVVIDGAGDRIEWYHPTGKPMYSLSIDTSANKIYGLVGPRLLATIEGTHNGLRMTSLPYESYAVAIDPGTHRGYVAGAATVMLDGEGFQIPPSYNYQGLWWKSPGGSESGWGINIAHQGSVMFAAWFTYDEFGNPLWFVMPEGRWSSYEEFGGTLYRVTGPPYTAASFDPSAVNAKPVGFLSLRFTDSDNGLLDAYVNDVRIIKAITKQIFAAPVPACAAGLTPGAQINYTDLWWRSPGGSESGWGMFLTHQGDNIFLTWFTYDTNGRPLWFVGSNIAKTGNATYAGTLYRTYGPPFTASPWEGSRVSTVPAGSATLAFSDAGNGVFTYNVGGLTGSKPIIREAFSSPPTVCR